MVKARSFSPSEIIYPDSDGKPKEPQRADFAQQQAQQASEKLARLEAQLRAMGINLEES
jgi:hypothetical protein